MCVYISLFFFSLSIYLFYIWVSTYLSIYRVSVFFLVAIFLLIVLSLGPGALVREAARVGQGAGGLQAQRAGSRGGHHPGRPARPDAMPGGPRGVESAPHCVQGALGCGW